MNENIFWKIIITCNSLAFIFIVFDNLVPKQLVDNSVRTSIKEKLLILGSVSKFILLSAYFLIKHACL